MLSRLAGRVLTSPAAFFAAGVADVGAFALASLRRRVTVSLRRRVRRPAGWLTTAARGARGAAARRRTT